MRERNAEKEAAMVKMHNAVKTVKNITGFFHHQHRVTVCSLIKADPESKEFTVYSVGIARCNPTDRFNKTIGEFVSMMRALDEPIPAEYKPFI